MTAREFCYWLDGFLKGGGGTESRGLCGAEAELIQKRLSQVFKDEDDPSPNSQADHAPDDTEQKRSVRIVANRGFTWT